MTEVYNLQDLISLGIKLKFLTKMELFKNKDRYENNLIDEEAAIVCNDNLNSAIYIKVTELTDAINSAKISNSTKDDIMKQIEKVKARKLDISNCNIITTITQLENAFKTNNQINDTYIDMKSNISLSLDDSKN